MTTEIIASILTLLGGVVTAWISYKNNKDSDKKKELLKNQEAEIRERISETEKELIAAMETNITDVPGIRLKLENYRKQLKKLIGVFVIFFLSSSVLCGCAAFEKNTPIVVGERVFYMNPGQQMTVPPLKSPAKQWYLIDDVAMLKVLGIDKPIEKPVIGVDNK